MNKRLTSSPVGQTVVDTIAGQFCRSCLRQDEVALKTGVDDLDSDVLIGESDDQAVFGGVASERSRQYSVKKVRRDCIYYLFLAWVTRRLRA